MNDEQRADAFAKKIAAMQEKHADALVTLAQEYDLDPIELIDAAGNDLKALAVDIKEANHCPLSKLLNLIMIVIKEDETHGKT